jgi:predicted HTH transcriptional regulator
MLDMIENSLYKFIDIASETKDGGDMVHETGRISLYDPVNDPVNDPVKMVLDCIKDDPSITYEQLAEKIGKSTATVKRYIQQLKSRGMISRVGSDKSGHWAVRW